MNRDDELIKRGNARSQAKAACEKAIWWAINACKDDGKYMYLVDAAMDAVPAFPQEMTAREYERILQRMEKTQPMPEELYLHGKAVNHYEIDKAISIVEQWAKEHPEKKRKTYAEDFFEKFPKARKISDPLPAVCRNKIYGLPCHFNELESCATCWNEEMENEDE